MHMSLYFINVVYFHIKYFKKFLAYYALSVQAFRHGGKKIRLWLNKNFNKHRRLAHFLIVGIIILFIKNINSSLLYRG